MALPEAVQRQLEQANELHKSMYEIQETEDAPALEDQQHEEVEAKQERQHTEPAPDYPEDDGHVEPNEESLEDKYRKLEAAHKTLQGKYRAEVPRLQSEVTSLKSQLADAKERQATAEKSVDIAKAKFADEVERLREEIGTDATEALDSYAKNLVKHELDSFKEDLQKKSETQRAEAFWDRLLRKVPNFKEINVNQAWFDWLANTDPKTGMTYQDTLNRAGEKLDVDTVIDLALQFEHESKPRKAPQNPMNDHVAPPKKTYKTGPKDKATYTIQDFSGLQDEIRRGLWRGREAEAKALENEIHEALFGS